MADVTISQLNSLTPAGANFIPISDGSLTGKATIASLPVDYNNITNKPIHGGQVFTLNGNFTVPTNIYTIKVYAIGGGSGGGFYGITTSTDYNSPSVQGPSFGTASYVLGFSLSATGAGLGFNNTNDYNSVAGTFSGSDVKFGVRGVSGTVGAAAASGPLGIGAGPIPPGLYGSGGNRGTAINGSCGGGSTTACTGAQGGYAFGIFSVTPGTVYPVVVGRAGGARWGTCGGIWYGGTAGTQGIVYIEW